MYAYFTSKQDLQLATIDCAWRIFEEHVLQPGNDAAIERQVEALEQALRRERGGDPDPDQLAFELHALLTAANHRFRISRDRAAFVHGRAAVRRLLAPV